MQASQLNSRVASDCCNSLDRHWNYAEVFHTSAEREVVRQIKEKAPRELGGARDEPASQPTVNGSEIQNNHHLDVVTTLQIMG